ncbi:hypothetical protein [Burkholderia plantarii]|uniref:hypothetical protein n=1 Tax=Burkholderia plantarii TaxID=41899 RepID=UPI0014954F10|nr:hypothetical protein [Burkholderia plantarii]
MEPDPPGRARARASRLAVWRERTDFRHQAFRLRRPARVGLESRLSRAGAAFLVDVSGHRTRGGTCLASSSACTQDSSA